MPNIFLILNFFAIFIIISCDASQSTENFIPANYREISRMKIKNEIKNDPCLKDQFKCDNNRCIEKGHYCDGRNYCGDNSDEHYCRLDNCPNEQFIRCVRNGNWRCVPKIWVCDGHNDCYDGLDEKNCEAIKEFGITSDQVVRSMISARNWILNKRNNISSVQKWGANMPKTAVAFHFSNIYNSTGSKNYTDELAYELSINLLSKLALKDIEDIKTYDLAAYVNSFLPFCINPRKIFAVNLITELWKRVDASRVVNPYAILALCNAREFISEKYIEKLLAAFQKANEEHRTDTQAIIIMALTCASAQPDSSFDTEQLTDYTMEIKKKQHRNGTVENIKTTALVLQALFASEPVPDEDNFDEDKAIKHILRSQEKDGSFGGLMNTYYVLPILSMSSLLNISGDHCQELTAIESEGLEFLQIQVGEKWNISYSIWIGDDKILQRSLTLGVPANTSFYGLMEYAAGVDNKFKFEYNVRSRKPYIFALSGIMDDPEMETFWYPYYLFSNSSEPVLITKSPADVIPKNNDHLLFWYKTTA